MILGGGFKYFLFSPLFGEDSQFDEHIFQTGWFNHQRDNFDIALSLLFVVRNPSPQEFDTFVGCFVLPTIIVCALPKNSPFK